MARWKANPPTHTIIAAGSTGTMPATAQLLKTIASLPQGIVILPGLDPHLNEEERTNLSPCHPQFALTCLLQKFDLLPSQIPLWNKSHTQTSRALLFSNALKPHLFQEGKQEDPFIKKALEDVHYIPCSTPQEEALVIALLFRQQLETPENRIALVTSDLKLAERVHWELKRWNIEIDRSSGENLHQTPAAVFLTLCAEFAIHPVNQVSLLSLVKHPLFHMQHPPGALRSDIRQFEKNVLRGDDYQCPLWIKECLNYTFNTQRATFQTLLTYHCEMAEALSTDDKGICHLWKGPKGKAVKNFIDSLKAVATDFPSLSTEDYPLLLKELFQGQVLRYSPQKHPRLAILGPLEARLFHADVMILGGLNEGTWPSTVEIDPWLNRPMSKNMGFPSPERRIGLAAHDFGQAFTNPKVYLTRALKVDGTPTLACRWLERLEVYLKSWNLSIPQDLNLLEWTRQLDVPHLQRKPSPPLPQPPLKARPRHLSVTQIETWMRDPYALYAKHILSLSPLNPLNAQLQASDKGTLIHKALDQFFKLCPDPFENHALETLLFIGKTLFEPLKDDPSVRLFWWPRFTRLARWFIDYERSTRLLGTQTYTEVKGTLILETSLGPFKCRAKADRIDLLPNGQLRILDYKTGMPPSDQDVNLGFSPQLPLEGAIALQQGFEGITSTQIESLQFWWLKGDNQGGVVRTLSGDPHDLSLKAITGLKQLVLLYEKAETPYPASPIPTKELKYNDYAHLARLQEWGKR